MKKQLLILTLILSIGLTATAQTEATTGNIFNFKPGSSDVTISRILSPTSLWFWGDSKFPMKWKTAPSMDKIDSVLVYVDKSQTRWQGDSLLIIKKFDQAIYTRIKAKEYNDITAQYRNAIDLFKQYYGKHPKEAAIALSILTDAIEEKLK